MPVATQSKALWRLRVGKMKNGIAVGVKSPALEKGRVFGRQSSVGLVWWLSNAGQIYNGGEKVPLLPNDPSWSESLSGDESQGSNVWRFRAGDTVHCKTENAQVSFRVNDRSWSRPMSIAPMAAVARGNAAKDDVQRGGVEIVEFVVQVKNIKDIHVLCMCRCTYV
jgi:hypothetical protein